MPTYTPNYNFILPGVNDPADQDLWGGYLNENFEMLDDLITPPADTTPVGVGMDYWGTAAPSKWVFAYGQALSRTTYADLFAVMGTAYGVGDGSTTFNLPDKRGRTSFGKDDMGGTSANRITDQSGGWNGDTLGASGGAETVTLSSGQIPNISIGIPATAGGTSGTYQTVTEGGASGTGTVTVSSSGGGGAHNNLPPGIVCNYIIYTGVA